MKLVKSYKALALTVGLIMAATFVNGATRVASVTGNWSNTATWGGAAVPTSADAVTINSGITVTVDVASAQCASLAFPGSVTASSALIISGINSISITGLLNMPRPSSGYTFTVNVGAGTLSCGSLTMSATSSTRYDRIAISTGTVTISGAISASNNSGGCQITFSGNGNLNLGGSISTTTITLTTFSGSTVTYTGAAQTGIVAVYSNLTLSGTGAKTFSNTPTVNAVLSLEGTASVLVNSGAITYGTSATLQYNKPAAYTATSEEWITPFIATGGIIIKNVGAITTPGARVIGNNTSVPLNINSGATLKPGASLLTFHGDFINAGTLTSGGGGVTIAGTNATQNIGGFTTTGTVSLTKTGGTATFTGNVNGGAFTLNGSGGILDMGAGLTHTFTGTFTRTNGTLNFSSSTTNINGTTSGTGGTLNTGTSTISYGRAGTQTVFPVTYYNLTLSGTSGKTLTNVSTITNNLTFSGTATATTAIATTIGGNLTIGNGATFTAAGYALAVTGTTTVGGGTSGVIVISNITGTKNFNGLVTVNSGATWNNSGNSAITIQGGITNNGTFTAGTGVYTFQTNSQTLTGTFSITNLTINLSTGLVLTAAGDLSVAALTTTATSTLNMETNSLTITDGSAHSGLLRTQNTSSLPISSGLTWGGTVQYDAATSQTVVMGMYKNLTISGAGGAVAEGDITVDGVLSLLAANPSTTSGSLEMVTDYGTYPTANDIVSYYLFMGEFATTTGIGDVTGFVIRTTIGANTSYTFGNQFTTVSITSDGTLPTELRFTIKIGAAPSGKTDAIYRHYEIIPTGGSSCFLDANFHYLDAELNGNTETNLVTWDCDYDGGLPAPDEHGRSAYDFSNNYVGMSNIPIDYFIYVDPDHAWRTIFTLGNYGTEYKTWTGNTDTDWSKASNWLNSSAPTPGSMVLIPNTANDPVLPATVTVNTITIQSGGNLVMGSSTITIANSLSGGWEDQSGLSDPGTSTVIFANTGATVSGIPNFFNLQIGSGANLTSQATTTVKIKGTVTKSGTWLNDIYGATVEYNGASQTIVVPDGTPAYHNLILSGSGTKTLDGAVMIHGNLTIGSGTTFDVGSYSLDIGGDFTHNGTFSGTSNTITLNGTSAQTIGGSNATTFDYLTVDNSAGVLLSGHDLTVNTELALSNGSISTQANKVIITSGGAVSRTNGWVNGNLQKTVVDATYCDFETGTTVYALTKIRANISADPVVLTVKVTNGNPVTGSGINQAAKCNHYWSVTKSGAGTCSKYFIQLFFDNTNYTGNTINYKLRKYQSEWEDAVGSVGGLTIQASDLTSFGDFEVGEASSLTVTSQPSNSSICSGSNTSFTAVSASVPAPTVKWQRSTGGAFVDIDGTTDGGIYSTYNTTTLNVTGATAAVNAYLYKAVFTNINGSVSSNTVVLTVSQVSSGGTLSGGGNVCSGTNSTLLSLGSYTGTIIKWQYSTDGGTLWTDFSNTSASYTATNISTTTVYKVVVQSGVCSSASSTQQTLTLTANSWQGGSSGNWEVAGNWCGGVPVATSEISIPASTNVHITSLPSSPAICYDLTITSGGILTIDAGKALTVNGTLTNNAGATGIEIKSDATGTGSLLNSTSNVSATVDRYMNDTDWSDWMDGWHFLSSPVASQAVSPNFTGGNYDFYCWYEPGNVWVNYKNTTTTPTWNTANGGSANFIVGKGYMAAYDSPDTKVFSGVMNVSDVTVADLGISGTGQYYYSWHLLGNPFASALTWDASSAWGLDNIAGVAKIWNEANQSYSDLTSTPATYIPATNGFMVEVVSGTGSLNIPESKRTHNDQAFYKSTANLGKLKLVARNLEAGNAQECNVLFNPDATSGFDLMYDGEALSGYGPTFYAVSGDRKLSTNTLPELTPDLEVQLNFAPNSGNRYQIEVHGSESVLLTPYLLDKKTNTDHNLSFDPTYDFTSAEGDAIDRFLFHFVPLGISDSEIARDFSVYMLDGNIMILSDHYQKGNVIVTDVAGRTIASAPLLAEPSTKINMQGHAGIYIVSIFNSEGVSNYKLFVR